MRKTILTVLSAIFVVVILVLSGCADDNQNASDATPTKQVSTPAPTSSETEGDESKETPNNPPAFTSDLTDPFTASDKEVDYKGYYEIVKLQEGTENEVEQGTYYLAVKNNTQTPLYIEALVTAKDSSGNILKKQKACYECVGSGEVSFDYVIFDARFPDPFDTEYPGPTDAEMISDIEVELQFIPNSDIPDWREDHDYKPIASMIEVKKYENKDKRNVVVTAKNNGEYNAFMPEAHILFFDKENNVIGHSSILFTDEDLELKSGDTQFGEESISKEYDHTELYMAAYSKGSTAKHNETVTKNDIEIVKEIDVAYSGPYQNTRCMRYFVIKNNSDTEAEIELNSIAWDKNGHALAAGLGSIDVLGPGQTSICSVMYSNVLPDEIDHADDSFYFKIEGLNYTDILESLSYETSEVDDGITISVKNNGAEAAHAVLAYVFFYDNSEKLVGVEWNFITDDDLEIKPGATETKTIVNEEKTAFDHVEVYLTGTSPFKSAYTD